MLPVAPARSTRARSALVDMRAGTNPKARPPSRARPNPHAKTIGSTAIASGARYWRDRVPDVSSAYETACGTMSAPSIASSSPSPPPPVASRTDSSMWSPISRTRPAPNAARTATSDCLADARATKRLATLPHAMSSNSTPAPHTAATATRAAGFTRAARNATTSTPCLPPPAGSGYCSVTATPTISPCFFASSTETPARSRPTT